MLPTFLKNNFKTNTGESLPRHYDAWSGCVRRDPKLWHLDGFNVFEGRTYPIASNISSVTDARRLATVAKRTIKGLKPNVLSRSQVDKIYVLGPHNRWDMI